MESTVFYRAPLYLPDILRTKLPQALTEGIRRCGVPRIEELRLHADRICTVSCGARNYSTGVRLDEHQLGKLLNELCGGSLYAYSQTVNQGYLTLEGGIRIGVCGSAAVENGRVTGVSRITGLTVRIPHAVNVDIAPLRPLLSHCKMGGGILLYAPPGEGKTTVLRALIRLVAAADGFRTVVVDTRSELKHGMTDDTLLLDILENYPRHVGIEIAIRSMGAQMIVCDEIGNDDDAAAILHAANCGVPLIATAHGSDVRELLSRPAMEKLYRAGVFHAYVGLVRNNTVMQYRITPHRSLFREFGTC